MDFRFDDTTKDLQERLTAFMEEKLYPAEQVFAEQHAALDNRWAWSEVPHRSPVLHPPARGRRGYGSEVWGSNPYGRAAEAAGHNPR